MNDTILFFVLYSYVHINYNGDEALVINTETKEVFHTRNKKFIASCQSISLPTIYYMLSFSNSDILNDKELAEFLDELEKCFCGELIESTDSNKPIQISPQINIGNNSPINLQNMLNNIGNDQDIIYKYENELGNNVLSNVLELSIYYNTLNSHFWRTKSVHKQYLFPISSDVALSFQNLEEVFKYSFPRLCKVNIIVGDITSRDIQYICKVINEFNLRDKVSLYLYNKVLNNGKIDDSFFELFNSIYIWYNDQDIIHPIYINNNVRNLFLVSNGIYSKEVELNADDIYPYYDGGNLEFCTNYLSYNIDDVLALNEILDDRKILTNQYLNSNFYGEISIYPNGDVYSCKNCDCIGNLWQKDLKDIIYKEISSCRHWFMTRNSIPICKDCIYNQLCPPITNLELELKNCHFCVSNHE